MLFSICVTIISSECSLNEFLNMEKTGHRYMVQHFYLKSLSPINSKAELDSTLGKFAPLFTTIKYWVAEFKRDRTTCQGEHRRGRQNEMTTPEMVKNPQNDIGCLSTKSARAIRHCRHFKKCRT